MYLHDNDTYTEHNHDKIHDNKHYHFIKNNLIYGFFFHCKWLDYFQKLVPN